MKDEGKAVSIHFILHPSSFILPAPSLTVGLPQVVLLLGRRLAGRPGGI
ncbi:MAG TPA: hypothetical protein VFZ44_13990 [Pyrinomonadaceae bacterium]